MCIMFQSADPPTENLYLGFALLIVIVMTGVFAYVKESRAAKVAREYDRLVPRTARVVREVEELEVPAEDLVLGDILLLRAGDIVPADCRIIDCGNGFTVDNSCITGESEPIELDPTATHEKQLFSRNMAFSSACVVRGHGRAVVTRTVSNFFYNKIFGNSCFISLLGFTL